MNEEWKDIDGYDGAYQISSLGNVRSWKSKNGKGEQAKTPYALSKSVWGQGYQVVNLWRNGEQKLTYIHRLVARAFFGESGKQVNHKNGDKKDNCIDNLEYVTSLENRRHAIDILGMSIAGEAHAQAKLTEDDVMEIIRLHNTGQFTNRMIADKFNVCPSNVCLIANGKRWTHVTKRKYNGQIGATPNRVT